MSEREVARALARVRENLRRYPLLPFTDSSAPSVVSIVTGAPVVGSWWGHPSGRLIYEVGEALDSTRDLLLLKLWRGKQTLVDRRLWPPLVRIGRARDPWQISDLTDVSLRLLDEIERGRKGRTDAPALTANSPVFREALRALEKRLLVITRSVHSSTGAHALEGLSWASWSRSAGVPSFEGTVAAARRALEAASGQLAPGTEPWRLLPWGRSGQDLERLNRIA